MRFWLEQGEKYDESVDIWAVGIIMFELLVGKPPFEAPVRGPHLNGTLQPAP